MDFLSRGIRALALRADRARRQAPRDRRRQRRLGVERLEARQLLALTHLYTFNDGLANDWVGNAHGTLVNGATVVAGQLVLANTGVTSGQTSVVQHVKLPAGVLPAAGSFTIEAWYATADAANWARVFDVGDQAGASGNSYVFFTPQSAAGDSRAAVRPAGSAERLATAPTTDDGQQHMAAVVVDAGAGLLRLYIDGVEASTAPLDGATAASVNGALAYLGRSLFNADPGFTGSINELRIYDEARTAELVQQDAAQGPTTATKSPQVRQMEYLNRGIVAIRRSSTQMYVSWRLLGTDPGDIAFNVYRSANNGAAVKLNGTPIVTTTDFVDATANFAQSNRYFVRAVIGGVELDPSESFTVAANTAVGYYLEVPLQIPAGGTTPSGEAYTYAANDATVADVDGDGQYEIILKWDPSNSKDNSQSGYTGNVYIDAYTLGGQRLWRIDLGRNIRAGAHYTQMVAYDFDGDGKAEIALRTAPGTIDGAGQPVLMGTDSATADYRNSSGYILTGPEYLTIFNGQTGAAMASAALQPARGSVSQWGDSYGNRVDRFNATVAYLDGERPSLVMARGYYGPQSSGGQARNEIAAYDFRDGQLTLRWIFKAGYNINNNINSSYIGEGTHSIVVADVDGDGKDEIIYGASAIDDNGVGLYATRLGHGDALHVSDMDPTRPGLEVFQVHESTGTNGHIGSSLRDARTGAIIAGQTVVQGSDGTWPDVGRGVAMDIDPNYLGYEFWDSAHSSIYDVKGNPIYAKNNAFQNFGVWWDSDLLRELLDGTTISKWNYNTQGRNNFDLDPNSSGTNSAPGVSSNNGTKSTPALSADIFGDWREEVIWRTSDNTKLRIFTTPIPATNRLVTLMHDSQYRSAIAWQNSAYNQPPHPSFFLGAGMTAPPPPQLAIVAPGALAGDFNGDRRVDALDRALWMANFGRVALVGPVLGDADGDFDVDGSDFLAWQRNVGGVPPSAAAALAPAQAVLASSLSGDAGSTAPLAADAGLPPAVRAELFARLAGNFVSPTAPPRPQAAPPRRDAFPIAAAAATADNVNVWGEPAPPTAVRPALAPRDVGARCDAIDVALAVELLADAL